MGESLRLSFLWRGLVLLITWSREGENDDPVVEGERDDGEDAGEHGHVHDDEVEAEGDTHGQQEPRVDPRRHLQGEEKYINIYIQNKIYVHTHTHTYMCVCVRASMCVCVHGQQQPRVDPRRDL